MTKLTIIRGVPGSGQTTHAKELAQKGEIYTFYEADMYFLRPGNTYDFNPKLLKQAHAYCFETIKWWLERNHSVAVANTFTRLWEMDKYTELAEEMDCDLEIVRCLGEYGNTHGVPEETVTKMLARFEDYEGETLVGGEDE